MSDALRKALTGVNVAAVTPHKKEGHEPDFGALLDLLDYLAAAGARGVALLGSTGEFLHMSYEDRIRLVNLGAKRSRLPVIAGVAHSTLDGAVELARQAADAGAAALLLMPPYFFRYKQDDVKEFFLRFADGVGDATPILLYNIPFFTTEIAVESAVELLRTGRFAGIKDSSGSFEYFSTLKALLDEKPFTLLIGNDVVFTRARSAGAHGVVSGCACAIPELMLGLDRAIQASNLPMVDLLQGRLAEFIRWLEEFPTPVGVKEATAARGVKVGPLAVPLSAAKLRKLDEFREWFRGWVPQIQKETREV